MGELGLKVTDVATSAASEATWVSNGVLVGMGLGLVVGVGSDPPQATAKRTISRKSPTSTLCSNCLTVATAELEVYKVAPYKLISLSQNYSMSID